MASESILLYFKARSQNLFTESSDLDKLTTNLCNGELELVYILSRRGKKRRVIKLLSPVDLTEVGEYVSQHSTRQTIAHFECRFDLNLNSIKFNSKIYFDKGSESQDGGLRDFVPVKTFIFTILLYQLYRLYRLYRLISFESAYVLYMNTFYKWTHISEYDLIFSLN